MVNDFPFGFISSSTTFSGVISGPQEMLPFINTLLQNSVVVIWFSVSSMFSSCQQCHKQSPNTITLPLPCFTVGDSHSGTIYSPSLHVTKTQGMNHILGCLTCFVGYIIKFLHLHFSVCNFSVIVN